MYFATKEGQVIRTYRRGGGAGPGAPAPPQSPVQLGMAQEPTPSPAQVDCANWNTAAFFKSAEASDVTLCLQAGADLEVRDVSGSTPLRLATEAGNLEAVTTLSNAGADPNTRI